jgi:hypothetical protein
MTTCDSCGSTILIDDEVVRKAGEQGVMSDVSGLFRIGDTIRVGRRTITIFGQARFSYGRGFWDEFWGQDSNGDSIWISVDEGDIAVQRVNADMKLAQDLKTARVGDPVHFKTDTYVVVEAEEAECISVRGSFDHELIVGETYRYKNAQADGRALLSYEYWPGGSIVYLGQWFSPFEIEVVQDK